MVSRFAPNLKDRTSQATPPS
uniref:Uncharacterized protein n=1 Tax=Anguilla anguilla TaxID=7936 RepID=A0A0E9TPB7_ANGAN